MSATEGENTIVLWAVDGAGNENAVEIDFIVDTDMPHLVLTAPSSDPQLVMTERFTIAGTVWDGETATASGLLLDGHPYSMIADGTGGKTRVDLSISEQDGSFQVPVDLSEGMNEFTVTVTDTAGNAVSKRVRLVLDTTAPLLTVVLDPSRTTEDGTVVVWGDSVHIAGSTDVGASLTLNGVPVYVGETGAYDAYLKLPSEGAHTLTLTSVDMAGNVRQVEVEVSYKVTEEDTEGGTPWALIGGIVVFLVLVLLALMYVRSHSGTTEEGTGEAGDEVAGEGEDVTAELEEDVAETDEWTEEPPEEPEGQEEDGSEDLDELLDDLEDKQGGES
jgi:hypothetical protein